MATEEITESQRTALSVSRSLWLIWLRPSDRTFVKVARLDELVDGRYLFGYLDAAASEPEFTTLDGFDDPKAIYVTDALPAFFQNRVMTPQRIGYEDYSRWLGLESDESQAPFEILVRTGGSRATDTFHVVGVPLETETKFECRFFVSGLRHVIGVQERLAGISPGDQLKLRPEPENEVDWLAVIVADGQEAQLGWVPNWLVREVNELIARQDGIEVEAEQINLDAPHHLQLLVRLTWSRD